MAIPNYVKFQRGTLLAYNRLATKDDNTLYFIYDANDSSKGSLYLGSRLIGSVGGSGSVNNLSELSDVIVNNANTGDFLVLNSEGKWTSVSAADVAEAILNAGGNFVSIDTNEFQFNAVDGSLELKGFSNATAGFMPVKSTSGVISWVSPPPDLSTAVTNLTTAVYINTTAISAIQGELSNVDGKISAAIANANHLTREIINDLSAATADNVIYMYPNGASSATNNIYDEYMIINGHLERTGSTDVDLSQYASITAVNALTTAITAVQGDLSNYVLAATFTAVVNPLTTAVAALQNSLNNYVLTTTFTAVVGNLGTVNGVLNNLDATASIAETLVDIYDRLTWQEISE